MMARGNTRTAAPLETADPRELLDGLAAFGPVLAIKLYRLTLDPPRPLPTLPCLDHEAMLHENIAPHMAAYIQEAASGDLHELVFIPARRRIDIDIMSTWGESSPASRGRLELRLAAAHPGWRVRVIGPSTERVTISRCGCQALAWSRMRSTVSGQSCIKPCIAARPLRNSGKSLQA